MDKITQLKQWTADFDNLIKRLDEAHEKMKEDERSLGPIMKPVVISAVVVVALLVLLALLLSA